MTDTLAQTRRSHSWLKFHHSTKVKFSQPIIFHSVRWSPQSTSNNKLETEFNSQIYNLSPTALCKPEPTAASACAAVVPGSTPTASWFSTEATVRAKYTLRLSYSIHPWVRWRPAKLATSSTSSHSSGNLLHVLLIAAMTAVTELSVVAAGCHQKVTHQQAFRHST